MESVFWVPVFLAFCLPSTRVTALQIVHLWTDSRAIVRELFDPIIARLKSAHKANTVDPDANVKKRMQSEWHHGRSDAARLGFAMVFGYLLQVPFLGPFTWFLGFVAAGLFAPELIAMHAFTLESKRND